ncbi:MAG: hypothetical protein RL456_3450 [Pseudomonadota bacterium]|jgi:LacI family transcriptional regulator
MPLIVCDLAPMNHLETCLLGAFLRVAATRPSWTVAVRAWNEAGGKDTRADVAIVRGDQTTVRAKHIVRIGLQGSGPRICLDDVALGRRAAEHLISRGFRAIAYRGDDSFPSSRLRYQGVAAVCASASVSCLQIPLDPQLRSHWSIQDESRDNRAVLAALSRPLGLVTFTCHVGRRMLAAAPRDEIPHALSIVACDYDPLVVLACQPALDAVQAPYERLGAMVAEMTEAALSGTLGDDAQVLLGPSTVSSAGSASGNAVSDPAVIDALVAMRAQQRASVSSLARKVGMSRRAFEMHFRSALGSSPGTYMRLQRLHRALDLLAYTSDPVADIARACGWASPTRFSADISAHVGMPPIAWRQQHTAATSPPPAVVGKRRR